METVAEILDRIWEVMISEMMIPNVITSTLTFFLPFV